MISHKLLRWISPILAFLALAASAVLAFRGGLWLLPLGAAVAVGVAALAGWILSRSGRPARLLGSPLFFVTINLAFLVGLVRYLGGARLAGWRTER